VQGPEQIGALAERWLAQLEMPGALVVLAFELLDGAPSALVEAILAHPDSAARVERAYRTADERTRGQILSAAAIGKHKLRGLFPKPYLAPLRQAATDRDELAS
jgi:hypothetical protein